MKRKIKVAAGVALVAIVLLLLWRGVKEKPPEPTAQSQVLPKSTAPLATPTSSPGTLSPPKNMDVDSLRLDQERRRKEYSEMWRTPIVFYGRVLDEKNLPVGGTKIVYDANTIDVTLTKEGHIEGTVYSNAQGLFEISGIKSRDISFQLSHPDYYNSAQNRTGLSYAGDRDPNIPDTPEKAWVFRMYKKRKPANLVNSSGGGHGRMDGSPLSINLNKYGQIKAEGTWSKPQQWDGKPFDWEVRLSIPNGGILECADEVTFEAPTEGYKPSMAITMSKDDKKWTTEIHRSYYIKLGNFFGRIDTSISTYHDLYLSVHYTINPTGSTNLESGHGALITAP